MTHQLLQTASSHRSDRRLSLYQAKSLATPLRARLLSSDCR